MSLSELEIYQYKFCEVLRANNPSHYFKAVHVYKFNAGEKRYLVTFEEYQHHVYVLQFCLEENQEIADKFNELANVGPSIAKNVIATCVQIGLSIYKENPLASFFFMASPTIDELSNVNKANNKRLSVYTYFARFFFNSEHFVHLNSPEQNSYLILNKVYEQEEPEAKQKIIDMFTKN
ncbi:hypothetical protein [Chryseobacterium sp. JK1]|uniref:hypothetical protein n=1 Tax=Chryseobacterium sp. JK1 TaxID=874294 RepID=UPI003D690552